MIQQLKAAFLLMVFMLNIVTGFACCMGVDMGFNSHHHEAVCKHCRDDKKDNCCNDKVVKIAQADKDISQVYKFIFTGVDALAPAHYNHTIAYALQANSINKYYLHSHHPPSAAGIRIAIRSFQI